MGSVGCRGVKMSLRRSGTVETNSTLDLTNDGFSRNYSADACVAMRVKKKRRKQPENRELSETAKGKRKGEA